MYLSGGPCEPLEDCVSRPKGVPVFMASMFGQGGGTSDRLEETKRDALASNSCSQPWQILLITRARSWLSAKSRRRPLELTTRMVPSRKSMASPSGSTR
jgi:hypothetical protein